MTYAEATEYLFNAAPLFQNVGRDAYKEGLGNTIHLDLHFGHPHTAYRTIHVAGTNGKGSCSHTLAAILQHSGLKVGLYTSPHLIDFRERIRINGEMMPTERVVEFVENERSFFEPLHPSFFELTTALAFLYFKEQEVDVAVVEVGLGGRLDCTNVITPDLSIITNISRDHTQFLGNTLPQIATEKAGIVKRGVPLVVGETDGNLQVKQVFLDIVKKMDTKAIFADEMGEIYHSEECHDGRDYETKYVGRLHGELSGLCQVKNTATVLCSLRELRRLGYRVSDTDILEGFAHVCGMTGLMGRWQKTSEHPLVICDTGHNAAGMSYIGKQIRERIATSLSSGYPEYGRAHIIIGMAQDKDIRESLSFLPREATYYFTQASVRRAMKADNIKAIGRSVGLVGESYPTVRDAVNRALACCKAEDFLIIGGSSFVVADYIREFVTHF